MEAIQAAQRLAQEEGHQQIEQVHLLLALVEAEGGLVPQLQIGRASCRERV